MKIKKEDKIIVIKGKDRGKSGKVVKSFPSLGQVLVEGINMRKKHQKPTRGGQKGQILEKAFPIDVSNVKLSEAKAKVNKK